MSMGFVSGDTINNTASKDVGFFGIFSGKQKNRIDLGGAEDKTHRLAIAYFDKIDPNLEFKEWVWLRVPQGKVKAEVASIAARLNISPGRIIELAREDGKKGTYGLELAIQKEVDAYKEDLRSVKNFYQLVSNFLQSPETKKNSLRNFICKVDAFDPSKINNEDIRKVCVKYKKHLLRKLNGLNDKSFKKRILVHKEVVANILSSPNTVKKNFAFARDKIENSLQKFDFNLFNIDKNFSIISAPKNVIRTLWGSLNLVHGVAQKIGKATGRRGIRLQLFDNDVKNRFSILTDGNIYHHKPRATKEFVPYSRDGQTWLLLNVKSLASRLYINPDRITKNEKLLNQLIDERMEQIERCQDELHILISNVHHVSQNLDALKKYKVAFKSESKWPDLFIFIKDKNDPLYKEFTKLAVSLFKILNKETIYEIKNKLVHKVEKKFWWNPLEDEIAFSDGNYNALNFTTNR